MEAQKNFKIVQMSTFFLYHPLYWAKKKNFYGFVDTDKYNIDLKSSREQSDIGAIKELISTEEEFEDVKLAICDPLAILELEESFWDYFAIIGCLVKNYAFWAVNHNTHKIIDIHELGLFEKLVCYDEGSTSYAIAMTAFEEASKYQSKDKRLLKGIKQSGEFIKTVKVNQEFTALDDEKVGNLIVITPQILEIERKKAKILYDKVGNKKRIEVDGFLGSHKAFEDVVCTAIITTKNFIQEESTLVKGIIQGILKAIPEISRPSNWSEELIKYTTSRFNVEDTKSVINAFSKIYDDKIFSNDMKIEPAHWTRTVETWEKAKDVKPNFEKVDKAKKLYYSNIKPFLSYTDPIKDVSLNYMKTENNTDAKTQKYAGLKSLKNGIGKILHKIPPIATITAIISFITALLVFLNHYLSSQNEPPRKYLVEQDGYIKDFTKYRLGLKFGEFDKESSKLSLSTRDQFIIIKRAFDIKGPRKFSGCFYYFIVNNDTLLDRIEYGIEDRSTWEQIKNDCTTQFGNPTEFNDKFESYFYWICGDQMELRLYSSRYSLMRINTTSNKPL